MVYNEGYWDSVYEDSDYIFGINWYWTGLVDEPDHGQKPTFFSQSTPGKAYFATYIDQKRLKQYKNDEVKSYTKKQAFCSKWRDTNMTKSEVSKVCSATYNLCRVESIWNTLMIDVTCMTENTRKFLQLNKPPACEGGNLNVLYTTGRFGRSGYEGASENASDEEEGNCVVMCTE